MRAAPAWGASTEQDFACFPTLACHGGLIHRQFTGQQVPVRRDLLAGGKRDDIPADNVLRRDLLHAFLPGGVRSPDTADSACADLGQPGIRRFGAVLGQRGDQRCQKDCQRNAARLEPVCAPEGEQQVQPRAHSRMRMTGSPRLARNLRRSPAAAFCVRRLLPPRRRDASTSAGVGGWGCAEPAETAERVSVCIRYRPFLGRTSAGAGGLSRRGRGGDLWSVRLYAALVRFMPDFRRCRGRVCLQKGCSKTQMSF